MWVVIPSTTNTNLTAAALDIQVAAVAPHLSLALVSAARDLGVAMRAPTHVVALPGALAFTQNPLDLAFALRNSARGLNLAAATLVPGSALTASTLNLGTLASAFTLMVAPSVPMAALALVANYFESSLVPYASSRSIAGSSPPLALAQPAVFGFVTETADGTVGAAITPTAVGSLLVVAAVGPDNDTAWTLSDTGGHTWSTAAGATLDSGATRYMQLWWAVANRNTQVTLVLDGDAWLGHALGVVEFSGVSGTTPFDTASASSVVLDDPPTIGVTTGQADEVILVAAASQSGTTTFAAGTGYTSLGAINMGTVGTLWLEYRIVNAQGTYMPDLTTNPLRNTGRIISAFRRAA